MKRRHSGINKNFADFQSVLFVVAMLSMPVAYAESGNVKVWTEEEPKEVGAHFIDRKARAKRQRILLIYRSM